MFRLFKKKDQSPQLIHHIYLNQVSKLRMLMKELEQNIEYDNPILLLYHFNETGIMLEDLTKTIKSNNDKIILAKSDQLEQTLREKGLTQFSAMVAELHPLPGKDEKVQQTIQQLHPGTRVIFYTSTDGPLMKSFGGEKIHNMMIALGMSENEKIEHPMVTKSIAKAQKKIKAKVQFEKPAQSKQEWMDKNVKESR
jgi:preprotein translocase subunit SecA